MSRGSVEQELTEQELGDRTAKQSAQVVTQSWLRMKWLTLFRGYRVHRAEHIPKQAIVGQVEYDSTWWLVH